MVWHIDVHRMEVHVAIAKTGPGEGPLLLDQQRVMAAETEGVMGVLVREIKFLRVMADQQPLFGGAVRCVAPHAVAFCNRLVDGLAIDNGFLVAEETERWALFFHQATIGGVVGFVAAQTVAGGNRGVDDPAGSHGCVAGNAQLICRCGQQFLIPGPMDGMAKTAFTVRNRFMDAPAGKERTMTGRAELGSAFDQLHRTVRLRMSLPRHEVMTTQTFTSRCRGMHRNPGNLVGVTLSADELFSCPCCGHQHKNQ